ncbi:MAG TPA: hemerythrin domain-containing protein [Polyangiaceae bacterium]|nr:hemerythrin domain-containing protein [Polyangiaceae bacterium]
MSNPPNLLNDDGTASIATAFMLSHHGFRRDLGRFLAALDRPTVAAAQTDALREEWKNLRTILHHHHEAEDHGVFPSLQAQSDAVAKVVEGLSADHRLIDPLLERGDRAFSALATSQADALAVVRELKTILDPHLATEEAELIPFLRTAKTFPPPATDAEADLYAQGFAWSMHGVAADVLDRMCEMLPEVLLAKLPAARSAFERRYEGVWGKLPKGATHTPIPDM